MHGDDGRLGNRRHPSPPIRSARRESRPARGIRAFAHDHELPRQPELHSPDARGSADTRAHGGVPAGSRRPSPHRLRRLESPSGASPPPRADDSRRARPEGRSQWAQHRGGHERRPGPRLDVRGHARGRGPESLGDDLHRLRRHHALLLSLEGHLHHRRIWAQQRRPGQRSRLFGSPGKGERVAGLVAASRLPHRRVWEVHEPL